MKKSKKWITFSVCAATLSLFLATNNFADETQTTNTTTSSTVTVSSSSSAPVAESTETSAISTETTTTTTTTESSSANTTSEVAVQAAVQEVKPIEGTIKNVNQENGTYDVVVKVNENVQSGIKQVLVPIWSDAQQKDIKWYEAKLQADGTWIVHMNIANHQYHRGVYTTHVYVQANDGSSKGLNLGKTNIAEVKTQLSAEIKNIDTVNGSYDVVVRGVSGSGIHHVRVPIWSTKNQSDIKWYDAVKQADGSYLVHMSISNHKNHRGSYYTHVYMYNNDHTGKAIALSNTNLPDINTKLEAEIKNVNVQNGSYDVVVNGQISSGIKEIYVPIWSDKNQKDIKWYKASKQSDGSYVVHMNIANHKYNRGEYMTHVYMYGNNGKVKAKSLGYTNLPDVNTKLEAEIKNVNVQNGSYDVVVKGQISSGIKEIYVPIWSDKRQKDIKWYKASKQSDGSYIVHMNIANHKYNRGEYMTHVYMYGNNGKVKAKSLGYTNLPDVNTKLEAEIKNINEQKGTYDVVINGHIDSGIKEIYVPIWSDKKQKDIKWYKASKQADGSYIVHMNIANHKYNRGEYMTHVYMYGNNGKVKAKSLGYTNLPDKYTKLTAEIVHVNGLHGTYDVVVKGQIDSGIKEIYVPIWSDKNQKDIKWYKASKQSDGSYVVHMNIANHKFNTGNYTTHVYMYANNGKVKAKALPTVNVTATNLTEAVSAEITNINQSKGTFDVIVYTKSTSGVKSVSVPVWHQQNQSDIKWYTASKVAANTYRASINVKNHHFSNGRYTAHVYMTNNKNQKIGYVAGNVQLNGVYNRIEMTNVPWISQYKPVFAPWGCASAAMAMLIESRGIHVDLKYAQDTLPMYPANKDGQLGNVYTGEGFGFVIKPSGLVRHAHKWTNAVYNISGSSTQQIIDTVLNGQPVLYYGFSGYQVDNVRNHCKVIVGYKDGKFKVHDPLYMRASDGPGSRGTNKTYSRGAIHWITIAQFNQEYQGNAITIK